MYIARAGLPNSAMIANSLNGLPCKLSAARMKNKYAVLRISGRRAALCLRAGVVLLFDDRARARAYAVQCALKLPDPTAVVFKPIEYINSPADLLSEH